MATVLTTEDFRDVGGSVVQTAYKVFSAAGSTEWVRFANTDITVQIDGVATAINVIVERTVVQPTADIPFTYAPVVDTPMSGNAASGIPPNVYTEPGLGWWRARVTSMTGASATVSLTGAGLSA